MHPLDALGDPVRRRLVELLGADERQAGELAAAAGAEFGISQPAVSRHLRVLREAGVVTARPAGPVRWYAVDPATLDEVGRWATSVARGWSARLDALGTEVARGRRHERATAGPPPPGAARPRRPAPGPEEDA